MSTRSCKDYTGRKHAAEIYAPFISMSATEASFSKSLTVSKWPSEQAVQRAETMDKDVRGKAEVGDKIEEVMVRVEQKFAGRKAPVRRMTVARKAQSKKPRK